jgi:S-DNA-T family DNA segregation ATPase FtsK/SpoIIIE
LEDGSSANGTYVNGKREKYRELSVGDIVSIERYDLIFQSDLFFLIGLKRDLRDPAPTYAENISKAGEYPFFKRSPRLKSETPSREVTIQSPPNTNAKPEINWITVFLPPAAMAAVSAAVVFAMKTSALMLFYTIPMIPVGILVSVLNYSSQLKKHRKTAEARLEKYGAHLAEATKALESAAKDQLQTMLRAHPETNACVGVVTGMERRLWERNPQDADFMSLRLGVGAVELRAKIKTPHKQVTIEEDGLLNKSYEIENKYRTINGAPILLDLTRTCTAGIVGERGGVRALTKNLLVQAATHHCYTELKIITLFPKSEAGEWDFVKWLPHSFSDDREIRFVADNEAGAADVLRYFEEPVQQRARELKEDVYQSAGVKLPFLLFVVCAPSFLEGQTVARYLTANNRELGIGALFLFDDIARLPKDCNTIVDVGGNMGMLFHKEDISQKTKFTPDRFANPNFEVFSRAMAPIRIADAAEDRSLPACVTFLEGYGAKTPEDIDIANKWRRSETHRSMSVPIGMRGNGEAFNFDIHEKKHGPHGLIAGMTGSGKSEMVQSWILSMALHHSPRDAAFVLIDFKGTGLILPFINLPHLAGTISDLDTNINRNLIALENELSRRKTLLDRYGVNNITGYIKLYKEGKADEPLAFLFVIIDEFAEFKVQFPDFMTVVDRIFAIGRTLGVFTLLLTQKPAGVVGDKMAANTRFRWCLKVASSADSKEMLRHPDAVKITVPGRAYVQVGEDEIYELIQSYWSGAPFNPVPDAGVAGSAAISFVGLSGKRVPLNAATDAGTHKSGENEIDRIVAYLKSFAAGSGAGSARKIWMNRLPERVFLPNILRNGFDGAAWPSQNGPVCPEVGMIDDPRAQSQYPLLFNISGDGHIAVYGAPGTGKTTMLQTLAMSLILSYAPDAVHIYIMDFGGWSMNIFRDFPHVGGVANDNDPARVEKTARLLGRELEARKRIFSSEGVSNIASYRESTGKNLANIVLILDNFAPVIGLYPALEQFFIDLTREGGNYGVYFVTSANNPMALGYRIGQNIKAAVALQMTDKSDYVSIVGKTDGLEPEKTAGRGLAKGSPPLEFQTALPAEGLSESERVGRIRELSQIMNEVWKGRRAKPIPIMPDVIRFGSVQSDSVAVGLSVKDVETAGISFPARHYMIVSGRPGSGKSNMLNVIAKQIDARITVFDLSGAALGGIRERCEHYFTSAETFDAFMEESARLLQERKDACASDPGAVFEPILVVIDDLKQCFDSVGDETMKRLNAVVRLGKGLHFYLLVAGDCGEIGKMYNQGEPFTMALVKAQTAIALGGSFKNHDVFKSDLPYSEQDVPLGEYEGYILHNERALRFKAMYGN